MHAHICINLFSLFSLYIAQIHNAVARIGFVTPLYLISENRPQENIDVRLFNNIVTGRSVTVTVVEQSILYILCTMFIFVYILYSNVCVQFALWSCSSNVQVKSIIILYINIIFV